MSGTSWARMANNAFERQRILVEPGDNEEIAKSLPRTGWVLRQIALSDWGSDWLHLELDEPITYQGSSYPECLIRSRWVGRSIGAEPVSVFLLLDPKRNLSKTSPWSSRDFSFVDWAMAKEIGSADG